MARFHCSEKQLSIGEKGGIRYLQTRTEGVFNDEMLIFDLFSKDAAIFEMGESLKRAVESWKEKYKAAGNQNPQSQILTGQQ